MGTKNNPGPNDCHTKAEPDEPLFTLLARDPLAPKLVRRWAQFAERNGEDHVKVQEALDCADDMELYQREYEIRKERERVAAERKDRDRARLASTATAESEGGLRAVKDQEKAK